MMCLKQNMYLGNIMLRLFYVYRVMLFPVLNMFCAFTLAVRSAQYGGFL
jgi:hypothetical protein